MSFFPKSLRRRGVALGLLVPAMLASSAAFAQSDQAAPSAAVATVALPKVAPREFNGDVRNLPQLKEPRLIHAWNEWLEPPDRKPKPDPAELARTAASPIVALAPMPATTANFSGLALDTAVTGGTAGAGWPPDVNGDVGPNHYIEGVNDSWAIYSKTGTRLAAFTENSLWSGAGSGTPCDSKNQGDPIVLHDGIADRWILTNFAFAVSGGDPVGPFYQCFAVSKTSNPVTGGWWLYAVRMDTGGTGKPPVGSLNDYGKLGLWTDCLYLATNHFAMPAGTYVGAAFASFSRADMYAGQPLTSSIGFISGSSVFTMIPSNLLGTGAASLPPAGTPNYFVSESQTAFNFEVRKFTAGSNCGTGGTLGAPVNVSQTSYTVPSGALVAQPGTTIKLDSLGDRLMQKVQYRKVGSAESLWVVHTVSGGTGATLRPQWAQINVTNKTVATTPVQQQIYAPDTTLNRWMGSLAVDNKGNMALGYSTGNGIAPNYPSIAYSGRLVGDTLNQLPQTERQLVAGAASQTNSCGGAPCERWGDYTAMSIDPLDDCTFWYVNEYYDSAAHGAAGTWQTRIGAFKFPSSNCGAGPAAKLAFAQQPSNTATGAAIAPAVTVQVQDASGNLVTDSSAAVTLALASNPGSSTLGGTLTVNAVNGVATFANLSLNKVATGYTLNATSSGLTAATSSAFNITPGAAAKLVFTQQPSNATAGTAIAPAITVQVRDANDNAVTTSSASIALALTSNPGGATLGGGGAVAASGGTATFANVSLDKVGNGYTLTASSSGLTSAISSAFAISPGPVSQLYFVTQPANVPRGNTLATVSVNAKDAYDNLIVSGTVTFSVAACSGTVSLGSAILVNGVAALSGSTPRFYTLATGKQVVATLGAITANSQAFDVVANADLLFPDGFESCRL